MKISSLNLIWVLPLESTLLIVGIGGVGMYFGSGFGGGSVIP